MNERVVELEKQMADVMKRLGMTMEAEKKPKKEKKEKPEKEEKPKKKPKSAVITVTTPANRLTPLPLG